MNLPIPRTAHLLLAISAAVLLACFAAMTRLDHFTREAYAFLALCFAAFAAYGLASLVVYRIKTPPRRLLPAIFLLAVLFRVPLWFTEPTLSNDIWRYLWDGRVSAFGVNPYAHRVDAAELDWLATPLRERVDHPWMATPYPPMAQVAFAGLYRLAPENPRTMQVGFTLFDLATAALIALTLRHLKRPPELVILYAWNPLIVVEFAHGAHLDSLMAFGVMLALYLALRGRPAWSAAALALATLTKFLPALLIPALIRRWGRGGALLYVALTALGFLLFADAGLFGAEEGTGILGAVHVYLRWWKTNDGLFYWLVEWLRPVAADPVTVVRAIGVLALLLTGGLLLRWPAPPDEAPQRLINDAVLLISVYLLFAAAVFPWYLAWLLALLPLLPLRQRGPYRLFAVGWLYFAAASNLCYLSYLDPANPVDLPWTRYVKYLPLFAALAGALLWRAAEKLRRPALRSLDAQPRA